MELVTILRSLWRLRLLVGIVAFAATVVGWMLAYQFSFPPQSRSDKVGIATVRVLVDTPKSQVVEVAPKGSETLGSRANVLANLMVDGELKAAIARRAGLRPNQLFAATEPAPGDPAVTPVDPKAHSLMAGVVTNSDSAELPIIKLEAQAPDTEQAINLANAAVTGLGDYLDSKAAGEEVSDGRRLQVSGLGAAQAHVATRGTSRLMALGAAIFVILSGCTAILVGSALVRGWRQAAAAERGELVDVSADDAALVGLFDDGPVGASAAPVEWHATAGLRT